MRWLAIPVRWHVNSFVTKAVPFCHKRFAASTSKTGTTGRILGEKSNTSLGNGMVPKLQKRQTFLTMCPCKDEQFTLNSWQRYDSTGAIAPDKAQTHSLPQFIAHFPWSCSCHVSFSPHCVFVFIVSLVFG